VNPAKQLQLVLARRFLARFVTIAMPSYELSPAHKAKIEFLESFLKGDFSRGQIIEPPRGGKTLLVAELLPAYIFGKNPKARIISISHGADLSEISGRHLRNILTSPAYQQVFPDTKLSPDSSAVYHFETTAGGEFTAAGRGGSVTGRGADYLILDDLLKDIAEANSETICAATIDFLRTVAMTRLSPHGKVISIGTRWGDKDPIGWFAQLPGVRVLHLPAISLGKDRDVLRRQAGEALWPDWYPIEALEAKRLEIGGRAFQTLYQGDVSAAEGVVFKRSWFEHYSQRPEKFSKVIQSWDTGFKTGATNDFSVCSTWGETQTGYYLLHLYRDKVEFPELLRKVKLLAEEWLPEEILVEDRASGQSLIQELKISTSFPVIAVKADRDKESRASACTAFFESGRVFFPQDAPWLADVEDELSGFPGTLHDDITDSITQALNRLRGRGDGLGLVTWMKERGQAWLNGLTSRKAKAPVLEMPPARCTREKRCTNFSVQKIPGGTRCQNCGVQFNLPVEDEGCICVPVNTDLHIPVAGNIMHCNGCARQWYPEGVAPRPPYRPSRRDLTRDSFRVAG
jgi:predicted phage terminase large subunit-like protein